MWCQRLPLCYSFSERYAQISARIKKDLTMENKATLPINTTQIKLMLMMKPWHWPSSHLSLHDVQEFVDLADHGHPASDGCGRRNTEGTCHCDVLSPSRKLAHTLFSKICVWHFKTFIRIRVGILKVNQSLSPYHRAQDVLVTWSDESRTRHCTSSALYMCYRSESIWFHRGDLMTLFSIL